MSIGYDRQELLQFVTLQRGAVTKSVLRLHVVRFRTTLQLADQELAVRLTVADRCISCFDGGD